MISEINLLGSVFRGELSLDMTARIVKHAASLISLWKTFIDLQNVWLNTNRSNENHNSLKHLSLKESYEKLEELIPILFSLKNRARCESIPLTQSLLRCCNELIDVFLKNMSTDVVPTIMTLLSSTDITDIQISYLPSLQDAPLSETAPMNTGTAFKIDVAENILRSLNCHSVMTNTASLNILTVQEATDDVTIDAIKRGCSCAYQITELQKNFGLTYDCLLFPRAHTKGTIVFPATNQKIDDATISLEYEEHQKIDSKNLSIAEVYNIALTVAQALSVLHGLHIAHGAVSIDAVITRNTSITTEISDRRPITSLMMLPHNGKVDMIDDIRAFGILLQDLLTTCSDKEAHPSVFDYLNSLCSTCLSTQQQDQINALNLEHALSIPYLLFKAITLCSKKSEPTCNTTFRANVVASYTFQWPTVYHPNIIFERVSSSPTRVSLEAFLNKMKIVFDPDTRKSFAACFGIQMLTILAWVHGVGFNDDIVITPDTLYFDNTGQVNILITPLHLPACTFDEIIKFILDDVESELEGQINPSDIKSCMQLPFFKKYLPLQVEPSDRTKLLGIDATTFADQFDQWKTLRNNQDTPRLMKIALDQAFIELTQQWNSRSMKKLSELFKLKDQRTPIMSSPSEWNVLQTVTKNTKIHIVEFKAEIKHRFALSGDIGVVKILEINDEKEVKPIRRAVTILEKSQHPNILRLLGATKQKATQESLSTCNVFTEFMDLGSLDMVTDRVREQTQAVQKNFFMAMTVQVLMGLNFLHKKLKVNHLFIDASHILINNAGRVKLSSFGAFCGRAKQQKRDFSATIDLNDLATMLEGLLQSNCSRLLEDSDIQLVLNKLRKNDETAQSTLTLPVFKPFFIETFEQLKTPEAKKLLNNHLGITEDFVYTIDNVFTKWREYDQKIENQETQDPKNKSYPDRQEVRTQLKIWLFDMEMPAILLTKEILHQCQDKVRPFDQVPENALLA